MINLKTFTSWGFDEVGEADGQVYGVCPFCDSEDKFYVNKSTLQWDCKTCDTAGNGYTFLTEISKRWNKENSREHIKWLADDRGISIEILQLFDVFWEPNLEIYGIPKMNLIGNNLGDIRRYNPETREFRITAGASNCILDGNILKDCDTRRTVWICEGEWDHMALSDVLNEEGIAETEFIVSLPGATTFKKEWAEIFGGHDIILCFDNDEAGRKGRNKAVGLLGKARSLSEIIWPEDRPEKWDMRDEIKAHREGRNYEQSEDEDNSTTILEHLREMIYKIVGKQPVKTDKDHLGEEVDTEKAPTLWYPGDLDEPYTLKEAWKEIGKFVDLSDSLKDVFKVSWAVALGSRYPSMPLLWMYLVGPPGCGKSLALMSLRGSSRVEAISSFTPASLISGFNSSGGDPSLLPQWNGKCVAIKDFTTILNDHPQNKAEIYGVLRDSFDGHVVKKFGNGVEREYFMRFTMLMGVTHVIKEENQAHLGERNLRLEVNISDKDKRNAVLAALDSVGHEQEKDLILQEVSGKMLAYDWTEDDIKPNLTPLERETMVNLVSYIAILRTDVRRHEYRDHMLYRPEPESATRMGQQLSALYCYLKVIDHTAKTSKASWKLVKKVAYDTARGYKQDVIHELWKDTLGVGMRSVEIMNKCFMTRSTLNKAMEDLQALQAVESKTLAVKGSAKVYDLTKSMRDLMDSI